MQQYQTTAPPPPKSFTASSQRKSSSKVWLIIVLFLVIIGIAGGASFMFSNQKKPQKEIKSQVPTFVSQPATAPPASSPAFEQKQKNWKVFSPPDHTFVSPDKSFRFVYPQDWAYETVDGVIPQQQHLVNLGKKLTEAERQEQAQKAGIPLTDSFSGISYTSQEITLYYTNTPAFQVPAVEALASAPILTKKQLTIDKTTPAIEVTVECPTECVQILFTKGQATFNFFMARNYYDKKPIDPTPLEQIVSSFTFSQ